MVALPAEAPALIPMNLASLCDALPDLNGSDRALIERAYKKAEAAHANQFRKSGEPYFTHCVAVAHILAELHLDAEAIAGGLMHDLLEDTSITVEELRKEFGDAVATIVEGVTKMKDLPNTPNRAEDKKGRNAEKELEYIRKMAMYMGDDVRVVLVKLADRLHNMRTLGYMPEAKQRDIAQQTLDIFAPLANRLGIWQIKWELEDLAFRYLQPEAYRMIAASLDDRRSDRESYINNVIKTIKHELVTNGLPDAIISGRPKHIYSIYKKMQRKDHPVEQIYDVRAVRVIVDTIPQCYLALGIVHNLWRPIPAEFDDYVANPKDNFYRSLHTAVYDTNGKTVEVQIRTWDMHQHAEYGIAAHWLYKEGGKRKKDAEYEKRLNYLRELMSFPREGQDAKSFVDTMKTEVFQDRVLVFTPKGDIQDLPAGATPIDFAYHIHTDIGHRCRGAKINGRLVSLDYTLQTGDQVDIITAKRGGPSYDWLNPNLGFTTTARARDKIRYWFRKQNREHHVQSGRELLEREMKRLGVLDAMPFERVSGWFSYDKLDDFLAALGAGDINGGQVASKILEVERKEEEAREREMLKARPTLLPTNGERAHGISVLGASGMLITLARCCNPLHSDPIIGFVTRGRGVTVHREDCPNLKSIEPERQIEVTWGIEQHEQRFSVPLEIIAYDRDGLMRDVSTVVADEKVSMSDVSVKVRQDIATFNLVMEIASPNQLSRLIGRLENINSVVEVHRRTY